MTLLKETAQPIRSEIAAVRDALQIILDREAELVCDLSEAGSRGFYTLQDAGLWLLEQLVELQESGCRKE